MKGYEIVGREPSVLRVYGATLVELFEEAAYAVFDQGYVLEDIPATYSRPVIAAGNTADELLVAWIAELLAMARTEELAPSYFVVDRLEEGGVQGSAAGLRSREVGRRGPAAVRLVDPLPSPVEIPEGWWVDLTIELEERLRSV